MIAPLPYLLLVQNNHDHDHHNHNHNHTPESPADVEDDPYPYHQPRPFSTRSLQPTTERERSKNGLVADSCLLATLSDLLKDPEAFECFVEGQGLGPGLGRGSGQDRSNSTTSTNTRARASVKVVMSPFVLDTTAIDDSTGSPHTDEEEEEEEDQDTFPRTFFRHLGVCLLAGAQGQGLGPAQGLGQGPERLADLIDGVRFKLLIVRCMVSDYIPTLL